jgi:hypothetical protein
MITLKNMCLTEGCYNDKEYGNTITYWTDKWGNERFSAPTLDLCIFCRINEKAGK